jgi:hypothetical protein
LQQPPHTQTHYIIKFHPTRHAGCRRALVVFPEKTK